MPGWSHCSMWPEPTRVLEIGFGPGIAVREVSGPCLRRPGVRLSITPRSCCAKHGDENADAIRAGRGRPTAGDGPIASRASPFRSTRLLAVNSMGFWEDPEACLRTVRSLLRPGGRIAIASQPRCPGCHRGDQPRGLARRSQRAWSRRVFSDTRIENPAPRAAPSCGVLATNAGVIGGVHRDQTARPSPAVRSKPPAAGPARRPRPPRRPVPRAARPAPRAR